MPFDKIIALTSDIRYYNLRARTVSEDIFSLFANWSLSNERVAVISPHDDDAILGTGYTMLASALNGARVYVLIMCDGRAGYTEIELKKSIVEIRKAETLDAYGVLDIPSEQIIRFNYPDFSLGARTEWIYPDGYEGIFAKILKTLRGLKITRLLIPNGYREHSDHTAAYDIGRFIGPQVGDPILPDLEEPVKIKSHLVYSVWGDFSPDDSLVSSAGDFRANMAIKVPVDMEQLIHEAIRKFRSQGQTIERLIEQRISRICKDGSVEVYQAIDPRPVLDYEPYVRLVGEIDPSSQEH